MTSPTVTKLATARSVVSELAALRDPTRAENLAWFFKTGKGDYGEGDRFLGVTVPLVRKVAVKNRSLPLPGIARLLRSKIHEHRLAALEILVMQYERGSDGDRREIVDFYLANTAGINNWDLVDTSAPYILGEYLKTRSKRVLFDLAKSRNLWERRIAIVATLGLIRAGDITTTFRIARALLSDDHDLIHKAIGWALRETGKVSPSELVVFLKTNYAKMPRTALRYSIERFSREQRKQFIRGEFE